MNKTDIFSIMADSSVREFTKDIIRRGLDKDPVDAYYDALLAANALKAVMNASLGREAL